MSRSAAATAQSTVLRRELGRLVGELDRGILPEGCRGPAICDSVSSEQLERAKGATRALLAGLLGYLEDRRDEETATRRRSPSFAPLATKGGLLKAVRAVLSEAARMRNKAQDDDAFLEARYAALYEAVRVLARKHSGLPELPERERDPRVGLTTLVQWCCQRRQAERKARRPGKTSEAVRPDEEKLIAAPLFTSVSWRGHQWCFAPQGAKVVEMLCNRLRKGLSAASIAELHEAAESVADKFRLKHAFRGRGARALAGTPTIGAVGSDALVVRVGRGRYALNPAIRDVEELGAK